MQYLTVLGVLITLVLVITEANGDCTNHVDSVKGIEECKETEYGSYVECVRRRMKRDTNCNKGKNCTNCQESTCHNCDCEFCAVNTCDSNCDSCCADHPPCTNKRCCHKTCHSRCKSIPCRTDCRRNCIEKVTISSESLENNSSSPTVVDTPRHNITTIIDIRNVINSTNEINIPIQVNNTNYNNFTLGTHENADKTQTTSSSHENTEPCCQLISPRQCVPKQEYPFVKCFHLRKKVCGSICNAPSLVEEPHEICEQTTNGTNCHKNTINVPENPPNCNYQPVWPYIRCGTPQYYYQYTPPAVQLVPQPPIMGCPGGPCYNNVYGWGSYYAPPPVYGPIYAPPAPVYQNPYNYPSISAPIYPLTSPVSPAVLPVENENTKVTSESSNSNGSTSNTNEKKINTNPVQFTGYPYQYPYQFQQPAPGLPPWQPLYPIHMTPLGYQYPSQGPLYYLPPEVDIKATVSQPERSGRYAQITITDEKEEELDNRIEEHVEVVTESATR